MFVYVDFVNKALCFCLFMLHKAKNMFLSLFMVNKPISNGYGRFITKEKSKKVMFLVT